MSRVFCPKREEKRVNELQSVDLFVRERNPVDRDVHVDVGGRLDIAAALGGLGGGGGGGDGGGLGGGLGGGACMTRR